ncbi:hypothetical protein LTR16_003848 [Cryomyces antarcticus]|uniref:Pre-mRNA-splicing factor 38B n=1 Tax=Cryomyces antarcticus TaxID=329879 RepID=A0ABR0KT81_9PEZI|nr:hypothetical protein LTR16_003848 [Cryomyces antarcticus]
MPADTPLTDDYVADLLAKDARASSIRYSTMGMGALLPSRPTGAARKPNTRFLRNILKETDTHNAALLAREAEEAKARLRKLRGERGTKGKPEQVRYDVRSRVEKGIERQGKRRRVDETEDKRHRSENTKSYGSRRERSREDETRSGGSAKRRRVESDGEDEEERRASHRQPPSSRRRWHGSRSRGRSRSPSTEDRRTRHSSPHRSQHRSHRRRRQSYSLSPSRSASPAPSKSHRHHHHHHHHKSRRRHRHRSPSSSSTNPTKPTSARDRAPSPPISTGSASSDPLSPLLGPLPAPAVKPRGRGAFTGSSGAIDAHFAASYDPGTDVSPRLGDPDADDWDLALEALRDRQRWKAQGADRLRAAGFSEDEVRKWEGGKGGVNGERERERDEKDVKWKGRG